MKSKLVNNMITKIKFKLKGSDSMWYETIKRFYNQGLYTEANLIVFVTAGMITEEQMQEIIANKPKQQ